MNELKLFTRIKEEEVDRLYYFDGESIDVSELYATLIQKAMEEVQQNIPNIKPTGNSINEFRDVLEMKGITQPIKVEPFVAYVMKDTLLEKVRQHLMNMAKDIGIYMYLSGAREYLDEQWKNELLGLYSSIVEEISINPNQKAAGKWQKEYKRMANKFRYKELNVEINKLLEKTVM